MVRIRKALPERIKKSTVKKDMKTKIAPKKPASKTKSSDVMKRKSRTGGVKT